MPEGVEIEIYRTASEQIVGAEIADVDAPDDWFLKGDTTAEELADVLPGAMVDGARRKGKLLVLDLSSGDRLGLRFGMTGRVLIGGVDPETGALEAPIEHLEYSSPKDDPSWDRFRLVFTDGRELRIRDPRRLGGVEINPDESKLGPDAFTVGRAELRDRVLVGSVALKARLLDQSRVSGIGNLIVDETLWRAGLDPARPADSLDRSEVRRLHSNLRRVLADFTADGGSHTGRLQASRVRGGHCPRDGTELLRRPVGGRTTYSCPLHQR